MLLRREIWGRIFTYTMVGSHLKIGVGLGRSRKKVKAKLERKEIIPNWKENPVTWGLLEKNMGKENGKPGGNVEYGTLWKFSP